MHVHEYQAKELLKAYGAPVQEGYVAETAGQAAEIASRFGSCVVKAQIHSGGRGKAGGVKFAHDPAEAERLAEQILGMTLVTKQTGPEGKVVRKVLVTEALDVAKEYYLSVTWDHGHASWCILASAEGGTEIEELAKNAPEKIIRIPVSPAIGFKPYQALEIADLFGLPDSVRKDFASTLSAMIRLFKEKDASLVEVNPLVVTEDGRLVCLDAKVNFDDNALFRHPDIAELRDIAEEDPDEYQASLYDLNFVSLDGTIGCLVNGAGLAMATMDIISKFGGSPANFLDVGGNATKEKVKAAFEILLANPNIRAIFINIFGGIMKCDIIAEGVVGAVSEMGVHVPIVVRLEGTNVDLGRKILEESGLNIISASDMADGARKAVEAAAEKTGGEA